MGCTDVDYSQSERDGFYTLSFKYSFKVSKDVVFFALHTPYTLTMMRTFLAKLEAHPDTSRFLMRRELCRSIAGIPVPVLLVTSGLAERTSPKAETSQNAIDETVAFARKKPAVIIIARQHPGEVVASWMMAGVLRFLVGPSPDAAALRERFCFHIVPIVNVDGVIYGNSRCTLAGLDPNRVWNDPNPILHPEVFCMRQYLQTIKEQATTTELFLDFHGHFKKCAAFFYGCGAEAMRSALFPKLVSLTTHDVDFDCSRWKFHSSHNKTARAVAFRDFGISNSFTLETSFLGLKGCSPNSYQDGYVPTQMSDTGDWLSFPNSLFTTARIESIGCAVGMAMVAFFRLEDRVRLQMELKPYPFSEPNISVEHCCQHFELYDGSERSLPWLTYETLNSCTAASVLAELTAHGTTVNDLPTYGDDAGASDSEAKSDIDVADERQQHNSRRSGQQSNCRRGSDPRSDRRKGNLAKDGQKSRNSQGGSSVRELIRNNRFLTVRTSLQDETEESVLSPKVGPGLNAIRTLKEQGAKQAGNLSPKAPRGPAICTLQEQGAKQAETLEPKAPHGPARNPVSPKLAKLNRNKQANSAEEAKPAKVKTQAVLLEEKEEMPTAFETGHVGNGCGNSQVEESGSPMPIWDPSQTELTDAIKHGCRSPEPAEKAEPAEETKKECLAAVGIKLNIKGQLCCQLSSLGTCQSECSLRPCTTLCSDLL